MRNKILLLGFLSAVSLVGYLVASSQLYGIGFPLDDSWIHQTYARNLANAGEWAFFPGQPSGGSTAPMWAALLAPGHLFGLGPYVWTFTLGWLILWGLSVLSMYIFNFLAPSKPSESIWIGVLIIFEWHLAWSAASGMETLLFSVFILGEFVWFYDMIKSKRKMTRNGLAILGLLIGISAWIRPEGIILIAIFAGGMLIGFEGKSLGSRIKLLLPLGIGFLVSFGLYLQFNQWTTGDWWPNTFHAKQAEYAIYQDGLIVGRYLQQTIQLVVGVGALLLPGFLYFIYQKVRERSWVSLLPAIWILAHLGLYAWRLPVSFQHGRYAIPVMPMYFILGSTGMIHWINLNSKVVWKRISSRSWVLSLFIVVAVFWYKGATSYAVDVAIIESEMVAIATWITGNTRSDEVIAAHDIGALGYFSGRSFLDLAGLISPDVIPFIRDEEKLSAYLDANDVTYLITFPNFYPDLVRDRVVVFVSGGEISPSIGENNMKIYLWGEP